MGRQKSGRGGRRPGAGRKPRYGERMVETGMVLPAAVLEILDSMTRKGMSRSAVVLDLLAKAHKPIRDVLKQ